jgi:dihydroorotate dehydrogenase
MYRGLLRPVLFALSPSVAHAIALAALGPVEHIDAVRAIVRALLAPPADSRIAVRVMGLEFPSPLGLAAGFDKNARRARAMAALGFGHVELGTVTARPQEANPRPNMFRLPADRALVNRLGFPNEGAERVATRLGGIRAAITIPVGLSIGKSRAVLATDLQAVIADYEESLKWVGPVADFVVVNVSSPNTAGLRGLQARENALELLRTLQKSASGPRILVKMAPDLSDGELEELLSVVEETAIAGVVAINTTLAREGLATEDRRIRAIGPGGLSGPPLRSRAVQVVQRARARLGREVAIVGVGGVERTEHVLALLRAGANLVQMYTGLIYEGPGAPARIARELSRRVESSGARDLADLVRG